MAARGPTRGWPAAAFAVAVLALTTGAAPTVVLPWEVNVAEVEAGRIRALVQRLTRQFALYQLHLGEVRKSELADTAAQIDHVIESLERGSPSQSIPAAWTPRLREDLRRLDASWGPLRRIAVSSPSEFMRLFQEYVPTDSRRLDPLALRYVDDLGRAVIAESERLLASYHEECEGTGLSICATARDSGYAAMVIELATQQAVYVVADVDRDESRQGLRASIETYRGIRRANDANEFFAAALNPERGVSARAAAELLASLRADWDAMEVEFAMLAAGDEANFELDTLLRTQANMVNKIERLTAALIRFASSTYGG